MNPEQKILEEAILQSDVLEIGRFEGKPSKIDQIAQRLRKLFVIGGLFLPVSSVGCVHPQKPPEAVQKNESYNKEKIEAEINAAVTLKYLECDEKHPEKPCTESVLVDLDKLSPQLQTYDIFLPVALRLGQGSEKKIFVSGTVTSLDSDIQNEYLRKQLFITSGQPLYVRTVKGEVLATPITIKLTLPCSGLNFNITGLHDGKPMKFMVQDTSICISD